MPICPAAPAFSAQIFREVPTQAPLPLATLDVLFTQLSRASVVPLVVKTGIVILIHPTAVTLSPLVSTALQQDFAAVQARIKQQTPSDGGRRQLGPLIPKTRLALFKESGFRMENEWGWSLQDAAVHAFLVAMGLLETPWSRLQEPPDPEERRYVFEERAGIFEFEGGLSREDAEKLATEWVGQWQNEQQQRPFSLL